MNDEFVPLHLLKLQAAERPAAPFVSCIVPVYNEAANIVSLLQTLHAILGRLDLRHELIVVDDGSRDASAELVRAQLGALPVTLIELSL